MTTGVLVSGGLDSAVLLADEASRGRSRALYVSAGLAWEAAELAALGRLLSHAAYHNVDTLASLTLDMADVYPPTHWARLGTPPGYRSADSEVYLAGRNIVLLSKAGVYAATHGIGRLAMGTLLGNPFPDATPAFRTAYGHALSLGLDTPITVDAPYALMPKRDVIRRGVALGVPLELTLSCMQPGASDHGGESPRSGVWHCGNCNKCRERQEAFREAAVPDPTPYGTRRG